MSIQNAVERTHHGRRCAHHALAKSVEDSWQSYLSTTAFSNFYKRLRDVIRCILDDYGGNQLVEQNRGKLFRDAKIADLTTFDNNEITTENHPMIFDIEDDDISASSI